MMTSLIWDDPAVTLEQIEQWDREGQAEAVKKFSEDQPRDEYGRWSQSDQAALERMTGGHHEWFANAFDKLIGTDRIHGLREVTGERFHAAIQAAVNDKAHGAFLSNYSPEDYNHMRTFLAENGKVGGALKDTPDGHQEIVSLFNQGGSRGAGLKMLDELVNRGGDRLDCIGDGLRGMYEAHGFKVSETIGWNDRYAPAGWDYRAYGRPHVYVMEHP